MGSLVDDFDASRKSTCISDGSQMGHRLADDKDEGGSRGQPNA